MITFAARLSAFCVLMTALPCFGENISEQSLRAADAEQKRIIVAGDAKAQQAFMHPNYILNGPSNRVLRKPALVKMLAEGKMAGDFFERTVEGVTITGNIGIVMGSEVVQPGKGSNLEARFGQTPLNRRFTNVYIFEKGHWLFLARQASVVQLSGK
jgi:hypothetical protein